MIKVRKYSSEREETLLGKWCTEECMHRELKYSTNLVSKIDSHWLAY
jgi:hypothetical protein